jgi:phospholipid/cholesterol/gamma-HCH transport system substrate-binding protein
MSTIFNIRELRLPKPSRALAAAVVVVIALASVGGFYGWRLYRHLTTTTVTAYFPRADALYPGDKVLINGIRVGAIDTIEPVDGKTKVVLHYDSTNKVPANAIAVILNPSLVASRSIQLAPGYTDGAVMANNAVIPIERTQVPVEWDELREQLTRITDQLGPTPDRPKGPLGEVIESFADGLAGKGQQLNITLSHLSDALTALSEGRGDFFAVVRDVAMFVNTLRQNDQQFSALNGNLAQFTGELTNSHNELATALTQIDALLPNLRKFVNDNGSALSQTVNNLGQVTNTLLQPIPRNGLETTLHVLPNMAANVAAIYQPAHGAATGVLSVSNFANPLQFICGAVQAASRLGYQDSAELCAQYLAPILDAIKFNFPPFGFSLFNTGNTLPNEISYTEARLEPPPGYKDTTVPGVWSRATPFSHGNHEPGWKIAPGMDGLQLQPFTQNMLTPEDLSALLGAAPPAATPPDAVAPPLSAEADSQPAQPAQPGS